MTVQLVSISDEDRDLWGRPAILGQLQSVQLQNGARWVSFDGDCAGCKKKIEPQNLRGVVSVFPSTVTIRAVGRCLDCKLFTRFMYRLHDDMSITGMRDGKWVRWTARPRKAPWSAALSTVASFFRNQKS